MSLNHITVNINHAALCRQFTEELTRQGERLLNDLNQATTGADTLRVFQGILAPLNVALGCATTVEEIQSIRDALSRLVTYVDTTASEIELAEPWTLDRYESLGGRLYRFHGTYAKGGGFWANLLLRPDHHDYEDGNFEGDIHALIDAAREYLDERGM